MLQLVVTHQNEAQAHTWTIQLQYAKNHMRGVYVKKIVPRPTTGRASKGGCTGGHIDEVRRASHNDTHEDPPNDPPNDPNHD